VAVRAAVDDIPPLSLAVLRFGQGGVLLTAFLLAFAPWRLRVHRASLPRLALVGLVAFALFPLTFNVGLQFTEASRGALMLATMPLWSAWLARAATGERLTLRQTSGVVATVAGVAIAFSDRALAPPASSLVVLGDLLLVVTAALGALYGVLSTRPLADYPAVTVTAYAMLLGTAILLPAAVAEGLPASVGQLTEPKLLGLVVFLGIPGGALGFFLWTWSLSRLTPTRVAVYVNLNPVVAALLGAALLGEELSALYLVGFATVILGVLMVNLPRGVRKCGLSSSGRAPTTPEAPCDSGDAP
jgi:drug/metabolite transporter (DMT)-like permease